MKTNKAAAVIALAVLFISAALAQSATGEYEGFEDGVIGDDWYSFSGAGTVNAPGLDGTDYKYVFNGGAGALGRFTLNTAFQHTEFDLWVVSPNTVNQNCLFQFYGPSDRIIFGQWIQAGLIIPSVGGQSGFTVFSSDSSENLLEIDLDWTGKTFTIYSDGVFKGTSPFYNSGQSTLNYFEVNRNTGNPCGPQLDEIFIDGGPIELFPQAPTGLEGEVDRVATASTTGRIDLTWNLAPDDPDQDLGDYDYRIYRDDVLVATDTVDANDGGGVRQYTVFYTGAGPHSTSDFHVTAVGNFEGPESCTITLDLDTLDDSDGCGEDVPPPSPSPVEFSDGIDATVESWGFITQDSKSLFAMALVGGTTVGIGALSKWVAPSRWKNYALMGSGIIVAVVAVFITYLETWTFLIALMLGVFVVRGGQAARNTFFEVRQAIEERRDRESQVTQDVQGAAPRDFMESTDSAPIEADEEPQEAPEDVVSEQEDTEDVDG